MSTDGAAPRTRAEARALRAAAEAAADDRAPVDAPIPAGDADGRIAAGEAADPGPSPAVAAAPAEAGDADGRIPTEEAAVSAPSLPDPSDEGSRSAVSRSSDPESAIPQPDEAIPPLPLMTDSDEESQIAAPGIRRLQNATPDDPDASDLTAAPGGPRGFRRFGILLGAVLGILALVGIALGAFSLTQGPRVSDVQVDPEQAIEVSGSRVILTTNQPLAAIDPAQVAVEPAVPFTVDAAGRSVGIRFTVPLDDETTYTVRVADVEGTGGGPSTDLTTSFTTPASVVFLLNRDSEGEDKIFRSDLTGETAVPVFTSERIDDFRATADQLVVAVEDEGASKVLVMNRDGSDPRELTLPGDGFVTGVQVSERGGLVGYTYSDREISETSGRAGVLVTQPLDGSGEPRIIEVGGEEASIAEWQFVPDSSAVLFIDWDGALALEDLASDAGTQALGTAMSIMGVSRGTYTAVVERTNGSVVELNLADGSEAPLAASEPDYGVATTITPYPGGTLRHIVSRDENGLPTGQSVIRVDDEGTATPIFEVPSTDSILQACASPSGQYAAVTTAPDLANNPYDDLLAPLPQTLHTHILDLRTGEEIVPVTGFDISWCAFGPIF